MKRYCVHKTQTTPETLADWSKAECLTDFCFPWEQREVPPTEFRALWDEDRLHFRFDCVDEDLVLGAGDTYDQRVLGSDRVEIFLTPDLTLSPYYCFEMEPRGEVLAYRGQFHRQFDRSWVPEGFEHTAKIEVPRYSVQGSITLEALRAWNVVRPEAREFLAGVYRAEFRHNADGSVHSGWMPWVDPHTARPDFHVPASFGIFELA